MPPLHRHQLAHLNDDGWQQILQTSWDAGARSCLQHWAACALPLVVTAQHGTHREPQDPLALGLAAPLAWRRRRLMLRVAAAQIAWFSEFPTLAQALPQLAAGDRPALHRLQGALQRLGVRARVYGSAGWQHLSGLRYLRDGSDLDLWIAVEDAAQADQVAVLLQGCRTTLRIDGELAFPDGAAVAWREWAAWREGRCRQVLVKRLHGATLEDGVGCSSQAWPRAA